MSVKLDLVWHISFPIDTADIYGLHDYDTALPICWWLSIFINLCLAAKSNSKPDYKHVVLKEYWQRVRVVRPWWKEKYMYLTSPKIIYEPMEGRWWTFSSFLCISSLSGL